MEHQSVGVKMIRNFITATQGGTAQYRHPDKEGVKAVKRFNSKKEEQILEEQKRIEREETVLRKNGMNPKYVNAFQARWFLRLEEEIDEEVEDITWECRRFDNEIDRGYNRDKPCTRTCRNCGQKYQTEKTRNTHFCSIECRLAFEEKKEAGPVTCAFCGKVLVDKHAAAEYCSTACFYAHRKTRTRARRKQEILTCKNCGKKFEKGRRTKFCSKQCAIDFKYQQGLAKREYIPCAFCGKVIWKKAKTTKFCCRACLYAYMGKSRDQYPVHKFV